MTEVLPLDHKGKVGLRCHVTLYFSYLSGGHIWADSPCSLCLLHRRPWRNQNITPDDPYCRGRGNEI